MTDEREEPEWTPERREVAPELVAGYEHEVYPPAPVKFLTIAEQLQTADPNTLKALSNWGTGEINYRHTEIGGE